MSKTALMETKRYQPYPEYKDSGVEWLGEIPSHWNIFNGKRLFCNVRRKALSSDEQLAASQKFGVVPQSLMMEQNGAKVMLALKGTDSFRHVEKDNFVISLRSFEGGIEHSAYIGSVSPAYTVLEAIKNVYARYYKYLLKSKPYIAALQASTDSLRDGKSISFEQFSNIWLPLFEVEEQTQIANFLDHETAKIDTLIDKQQQLIKLLKEKRQAVISHAVTKGLNPHAPMKDSGVEWLGEVPEHWGVLSLQRILHRIEQGSSPVAQNRTPEKYEYGVLKISSVKKGTFYAEESKTLESVRQFEPRFRVNKGDLLVTRANTPSLVADACVINDEPTFPVMMCDLIYRLVITNKVSNHFLCMGLLSDFGRHQIEADARGSSMTMAKVSQGHIKGWLTVLPPMNEQNDIVGYVKGVNKNFALLISKAETAIKLMQERRTALISAAVTGKIDVRNWQGSHVKKEEEAS